MQTITFPINAEPGDIVKTERLGFFTNIDGDRIILYKVVREFWKHSEHPTLVLIPKINYYQRADLKRTDRKAASIVLLEAHENVLNNIFPPSE